MEASALGSGFVREILGAPNERWSLDFVSNTLSNGRTFRCLTVVDEFSREALAVHMAHSIPATGVIEVLEQLREERGRALEDSLAFYAFPREHWKMLRTNNPLEHLMKEIRRRTKVAEQFPNGDSALLLVTARLKRLHEGWANRRYLDMAPLYELEQVRPDQAAAAA